MPNPAVQSPAPIGEDGKRIPPRRGRPRGSVNKVRQLARENLAQCFEELGGVDGMMRWVRADPRNLYAFYVYIYPKILGVQGVQRPPGPIITRIINEIVDPRSGYKGTIESTAVEVID